jgi:hypothetical protein
MTDPGVSIESIWRTSSYSGGQGGECIQVAPRPRGVAKTLPLIRCFIYMRGKLFVIMGLASGQSHASCDSPPLMCTLFPLT